MCAWQDRKRGHWVADAWCKKQRITQRGFSSKSEARAYESAEKKRLKQQALILPSTGYDLRTVVSLYLDSSHRLHVPSTTAYKISVLTHYVKFTGNMPVEDTLPAHVTTFLVSESRTDHEWNFYRTQVGCCFNWYIRQYKRPWANPALLCDRSGHVSKKRIPMTDAVICLLLDTADPEEHDLLVFFLCTLARADETFRAKWTDWHPEAEKPYITLWTRKRKGGKWQSDNYLVPAPLEAVLNRMYEERLQDVWIFYNKRERNRYKRRPRFMMSLCKRAGIPPLGWSTRRIKGKDVPYPVYWGFHDLRHFMAAVLAGELEADLSKISAHLRHRSLRTTEIYLQTLRVDTTESTAAIGQLPWFKNFSQPAVTTGDEKENSCEDK